MLLTFQRGWSWVGATLLALVAVANAAPTTVELVNPTPEADDRFGAAVAAVGSDVVVGAPGDGGARGAAYLYDGATGRLIRTLTVASNPLDSFGSALAALGDDILVSAPFAAQSAGAVYLLSRDGVLLRTFMNPAPDPNVAQTDNFGRSLIAVGQRFFVGAPRDDVAGGVNQGAVFLFDAVAATPLVRTFTNPDSPVGGNLGFSVAAFDGDVVSGAPFRVTADGGTDVSVPGDVFIFDSDTGGLRARLAPPIPTPGARFGYAVAALGGGVLVGAPHAENTTPNVGEVHFFDLSSPAAPLRTYRLSDVPDQHDRFGRVIAVVGDALAVGAETADLGADDAGAIYVFDADTAALLQTYRNPAPDAGDEFGSSLAAAFGGRLIAGALFDDAHGSDAGAAYMLVPQCGNGFRDPGGGEVCDDGARNGDATSCCDVNCQPRPVGLSCMLGTQVGRCVQDGVCGGVCGNGVRDALGEQCDDGNDACDDGCDPNCRRPGCGNGFFCAALEECDDGNVARSDGCTLCVDDCVDDAECLPQAACTPRACMPSVGGGARCENRPPVPDCVPCTTSADCAEDPVDDPCTIDECSLDAGCRRRSTIGPMAFECTLAAIATADCAEDVVARVNEQIGRARSLVAAAAGKCARPRLVKSSLRKARQRVTHAKRQVAKLFSKDGITLACSTALSERLNVPLAKLDRPAPQAFCVGP